MIPALSAEEILAAKQVLKERILSKVNFVEISVRSVGTRRPVRPGFRP